MKFVFFSQKNYNKVTTQDSDMGVFYNGEVTAVSCVVTRNFYAVTSLLSKG